MLLCWPSAPSSPSTVFYMTSAFKLMTTGFSTHAGHPFTIPSGKSIGDYSYPVGQTPEFKSHSTQSWQA